MKYNLLIVSLLLFVATACNDHIKDGDLLFVKVSDSEFSKAIDAATSIEEVPSFDHVAIAMNKDGQIYVIEATPKMGVVCRSFDEFSLEVGIDNIVVVRPKFRFDKSIVLSRATSYLGRPYDYYFLPSDDKLYCSELVYESYVDEKGNHFFETIPMNFYSKDGTMPQFWIDHYRQIGMDVPQGVQGTNPNQIFQILEERK